MARSTLSLFRTSNDEGALEVVAEVLRSGWIGEGDKVKLFEKQIAEFVGTTHIAAVNSCTSALVLALRIAGVDAASEVISTPMTCTATNHAILQLGAKIVWADIDPLTGNIDPASVASRITERTRAVIVVHWGGVPCDMDAFHSLGRQHSIRIVEDAAHAFGSAYRGRLIGADSDFACYSFQAIKTITTGDGGALVCGLNEDDERARLLRWFGIERGCPLGEYDIHEFGYKFHMNDIAAAIGISGMKHLTSYLSIRRRNGLLYQQLLTGIPGLQIHQEREHERSSFWLANLLVEDRANFIRRLGDYGIAASPVHLRNDRYQVFKQFNTAELPGVDYFDPRHVSVPVGHWVTEEDVEYVAKTIAQGW
jgi:dTDP-4-amino-4,6-dideoxygalactose transaminase